MEATVDWPVFPSALIGREMVAERTMSFRFAKPADWDYCAGQFIDITLYDPPETDAEGDTRGFSISSAPCEDVIQVTTRLRDTAFKRVLQHVPLGTVMKLEGPFGEFRLDDGTRPAVVLTGGIGITVFRSIIVQGIHRGGPPYPVALFHANRRPEDTPFLAEMRQLASWDRDLSFIPTMTASSEADASWDGERGRIDMAMILRHVKDLIDPIYYITGPSGMVQALRAMLVEVRVPDDAIRIEEFTGY